MGLAQRLEAIRRQVDAQVRKRPVYFFVEGGCVVDEGGKEVPVEEFRSRHRDDDVVLFSWGHERW